MCDTNILNTSFYDLAHLKFIRFVSFGPSILNLILNPLIMYFIMKATFSCHFLSLSWMIHSILNWVSSLLDIVYILFPFVCNISSMVFNLFACHLWSSSFLNEMFIAANKQCTLNMICERTYHLFYPNTDLVNQTKSITFINFVLFFCLLLENLGVAMNVNLSPSGTCLVPRFHKHIFEENSIVQTIFFWFDLIIFICFINFAKIICMSVIYGTTLFKKKEKTNHLEFFKKPNIEQNQTYATKLILLWTWCSMIIFLFQLGLAIVERLNGYSYKEEFLFTFIGFFRSLERLFHSFTLLFYLPIMRNLFFAKINFKKFIN